MKTSSRSTTEEASDSPELAPPERSALLNTLLDRNSRWIEVADTKAGAVLVFATFLLKEVVAPNVVKGRTLLPETANPPTWQHLTHSAFFFATLLAAIALIGWAIWSAFKVLDPKLTRKHCSGHLFFADVANEDLAVYQRDLLALTTPEFEMEMTEQIHTNATIANTKHGHVKVAMRCVIVVIPIGFVLYVLGLYLP